MGWDNPPVPWREFEQRLSWRKNGPDSAEEEPELAPEQELEPTREPGPAPVTSLSRHRDRSGPVPVADWPVADQPADDGELIPWAELHCHSAFSFLDGASAPEELIDQAARLGLVAIGITDHDGMYGVPQFAQEAARIRGVDAWASVRGEATAEDQAGDQAEDQAGRRRGVATVFGAELNLARGAGGASRAARAGRAGVPDPAGEHLLVLARGPEGYGRLCQEISAAHLAGGEKGKPDYDLEKLARAHDGNWVILTGCRKGLVPAALTGGGRGALTSGRCGAAERELRALTEMFGRDNVFVELICQDQPADDERNDALFELAGRVGTGVVASNNVHYATPAGAKLAQALAAIRARSSLDEMDGWLAAAGTAYLRSGKEMAYRLRRYPTVLEQTVELAMRCAFDFNLIAPRLPDFGVPENYTEITWLRHLVKSMAPARYGDPAAERIPGAYRQIEHELDVIEKLGFAGYFLIVHDIVNFCKDKEILCQGRGSAANSAVCYALGITSVDPVNHQLLFERFLSTGRDGPPDIDLDIEHKRREEAIQHVYQKYGRQRAAQVANVIAYRPRMAIRDAGRALGYSPEQQNLWSKQVGPRQYAAGQPVPPDAGVPEEVIALAGRMQRLPRHLGIHSGGMVICDRPVAEVCPVEWARMANRSVLQWDKDDCAYAGLVKFDLLGLGMLTALRDCFALVAEHHGVRWDLHSIPQEDPGVYDMLCAADTVGVFQVESRAQMATLPRLRPREFYDLVVEVALIRPGPIQGGSVHPYMKRRQGDEKDYLPHESMRHALGKTLGVPLFQEQMMQIAIDCAGFSASEADRLRQAMSSKRAPERIEELRSRLLGGMSERGISLAVAEDIYEKILAFSSYGFPESHAISFAYLVYASAWLKCYYPAAFTAALLRAQPMGFYSPASLISDVRRHGVEVRGVDINASRELAALKGGTGRESDTRAATASARPRQPRQKSRGSGRRPAGAASAGD